MATSEYCSCPPRLPTPTASHMAIAFGVNHRVTSPRWTSARSYAGQFPTRYFVLYLGCTLDFTSRSCPFGRHDGQGRDEHLFPRTNADRRRGRLIGAGGPSDRDAKDRGHRQANAALYRSVIVRMRYHQPTVDYVVRRTADGRTKREIIRCLKRFLAREIYQRVMTDFRARRDVAHAA